MRSKTKTPKRVREELAHAGISISAWAKRNGFRRQEVYAVLNGRRKGLYGRVHAVAVALGLKAGCVTTVDEFVGARQAES